MTVKFSKPWLKMEIVFRQNQWILNYMETNCRGTVSLKDEDGNLYRDKNNPAKAQELAEKWLDLNKSGWRKFGER